MSENIQTDEQITAIAIPERSSVVLTPVMDIQTAMTRLKVFQEFISTYLQLSANGGEDGGDYGVIPGTKKQTLFKSGADKLCEVYGLYDEYAVLAKIEDWDKGLFDYQLRCTLRSRRDDSIVGTGLGSCSSFESKYRWRDSQRKCPACGAAAIIKGKDFNNDGKPTGWICFLKKGGCGAKFQDGNDKIEKQVIGRVDNPDIADTKNTVLKIAKKRAKVDATIGVTRSSGIFTQDMEDVSSESKKPEPVKLTEDIEITAPSRLHDQVDYIDVGQQANFHAEFRKAVSTIRKLEADNLCYKWLLDHGYVTDKGEPTAAKIPASGWLAIRAAAIEYARSQ